MPRRAGNLTAAWTSRAMSSAIASVAKARGTSKSQLVREALAAHLASLSDDPASPPGAWRGLKADG